MTAAAPKPYVMKPALPKAKYAYYTVQPGDTLTSIAQNYNGVTVAQIKALNKLGKGRTLRAGTKLKVPVNTKA